MPEFLLWFSHVHVQTKTQTKHKHKNVYTCTHSETHISVFQHQPSCPYHYPHLLYGRYILPWQNEHAKTVIKVENWQENTNREEYI